MTRFRDLHLEITRRYVSDGAIIEIVEEIPAAVAAHVIILLGSPISPSLDSKLLI